MQVDLIAILGGLAVGTIVGLTGVGGGSLMTPLLVSVYRLPLVMAIGTDLWFAALTKTSGVWPHHKLGHIEYRIVGLLLLGSLPAAVVTLVTIRHFGLGKESTGALTYALGIALLLTAVSVAYRKAWTAVGLRLERWVSPDRQAALTVAAGSILGLLVSLTSIGGGAGGATLLLLLYPRMETRRIVGTDIAHAVPLTIVAAFGHASLGHVDWELLVWLLVGSIPGIWLGALLTRRLPELYVRVALCLSLLTAGLKVVT